MASTSAILLDEERLAHEYASEWEITSGVFESCRLPGCLLKRTLDCIIHEMTHALFMIHSLTEIDTLTAITMLSGESWDWHRQNSTPCWTHWASVFTWAAKQHI
jgi:hypothetical protein